ncbi:MAG TPA: sigma-70 family RNA polymerase sigma factor [Actinomycetota bacterium]|nr:sigma-70 family RNA polymerase sigma factor [Actinomycetota bacterium]
MLDRSDQATSLAREDGGSVRVRPEALEVLADKELTLLFQRGEQWAYDSIYERYAPRVNAVCRRMLSDRQDAQDAAQETFLRVYQALPRFNGRYQLGAWINRIATNVCLDHLRARKRTPAEATPNEVLDDVVEPESSANPEELLLRSDEGARVQQTLGRLTEMQRTAILMRDFEGRDYSDIASTLGMSETRVRVLLHRARKGFRKSWSSAWVILGLPSRWLGRFRRFRAPLPEGVVHVANSAAGGHAGGLTFASCGQALQGCGDVVSERIAAVATAAIVGVTAAGGVGAATGEASVTRTLRVPGLTTTVPGKLIENAVDTAVSAAQQTDEVLDALPVVDLPEDVDVAEEDADASASAPDAGEQPDAEGEGAQGAAPSAPEGIGDPVSEGGDPYSVPAADGEGEIGPGDAPDPAGDSGAGTPQTGEGEPSDEVPVAAPTSEPTPDATATPSPPPTATPTPTPTPSPEETASADTETQPADEPEPEDAANAPAEAADEVPPQVIGDGDLPTQDSEGAPTN